jgi:MFS family permease
MPTTLRAFAHRSFRLFFAGQFLSVVGTWMQQVAMSWLVYRMTGSALVLGVVAFASQMPVFLISPFAGVYVDRWNRYRTVVATQSVAMVQAAILAALTLSGTVRIWHIMALAVVLGIVTGFDVPARQALLVQLVEGPADLANAIALNSSMFNGARLVGPAIAGLLVAAVGEGTVFLINSVSYLAVLAALFAIGVPRRARVAATGGVLRNLREGFDYAAGFAPIRTILLLLAAVSLLGMPYTVLLPVFASDVLNGGARALGFLMSGAGVGALAGALYLASRTTVRGLGRVMFVGVLLFGAGLTAFGASHALLLSVVLLFVTGLGAMIFTASVNTVLQTLVDDDKRGRIMSLYTMAFTGMSPFGSLFAGALASHIGGPITIAMGGLACVGAGIWYGRRLPALRALVRPIYVEKGIIPEVARGIQSATALRAK